MTDNLTIWNTLGRTSPEHTKQFKRGGGFTGTAIKPIYTEQKMTEQFGPCGIGWGFSEPQFQIVPGANNEVMVYCWLTLWFVHDGARSMPIPGVGGDKIISHIKANEQYKRPERWESDDEAFKKAFTDAIGNAMKHIGMSADVHMGRFDDSKYVSDLRREDAETHSAPTTGRIAAGAVDRTSDASAAPLSAPPRAEGSRPQSPAPSAVRPAAPLSAQARLLTKAAEQAMTKQEVTDWVRASGETIDGLPDDEPDRVREHARALYMRLPEKVAA